MKELAVFTGIPAFEHPLCVGQPYTSDSLKDKYQQYMSRMFDAGWFTNDGPLVHELEQKIAALHGVKHCVCTCNATIALILMLKSLDLQGEIIVPSFTFIATAHACLWQNLKLRFCDIREDTLTINPQHVEKIINEKTSAIIGVHIFGNICDVDELNSIAEKYKKHLVFDAAHAFSCTLGTTPVGSFGKAEVFSFHATKFFSTFEGGAILTNDEDLDRRLRYKRNFGFSNYDTVDSLGINGKMTEASAAMGLASLGLVEERKKTLEKIYRLYKEAFNTVDGVRMLEVGEKGQSNYHYVVIFIEDDFGVHRDTIYKVLWKENIIARRYFYPGCHRMEPYRTRQPEAGIDLPVTEKVCGQVLCLPTNLAAPEDDVKNIVNIIRQVKEESGRVNDWVQSQSEK